MSALEASVAQASQTTDEASTHDYIELKTMQDVEALEQKQLYSYIEKLHGIIRKYDTKIAIYKKKLRNFVRRMNVFIYSYICEYSFAERTTNVPYISHCS